MEYTQITLTEWMDIKARLKRELESVTASFVRIGYTLRKIKDEGLYKNDGYNTLSEFAKKEYNLSASTVSRFIEINKKYSIDGYSPELRLEFASYGSSKLSEMLGVPDSDIKMIEPTARREDIRNLKAFNRSGATGDGSFDDIVLKFFEGNKDLLKKIYNSAAFKVNDIKAMTEMVNPSGNRSYRTGIFFLMMYENHIMLKKFGSEPQNIKWEQFFNSMKDIYGEELPKEWFEEAAKEELAPFNKKTESGIPKVVENSKEENTPVKEVISEKKEPKTEIAPAQKSKEILEEKLVNEPTKSTINQPVPTLESTAKTLPDVLMSRKHYIDQLTTDEAAVYITSEYEAHRLLASMLVFSGELKKWLSEKVDTFGKPAE